MAKQSSLKGLSTRSSQKQRIRSKPKPLHHSSSDGALNKQLLRDVRSLIFQARSSVARTTNSILTATYWQIGERVRRDILKKERADYGGKIVESLALKLTTEFGPGFSRPNLFNMIRFSEVFPNREIVYSLSRQLTWTHFRVLIYQEKPLQREFYTAMCQAQNWNVAELQHQIQGMLYERVALSKKPDKVIDNAIRALHETGEMTPDMIFLDHVNLSALGLKDSLSSNSYD